MSLLQGTLTDPFIIPMRGVGGAKTTVANYLRTALPQINAQLRTLWALPSNDPTVNLLPDPDCVADVEQGVVDAANLAQTDSTTCLVFLSGLTTPKITQVLINSVGDAVYDTTYQLSATAWIRGHRKETVIRSRDNVATAIRYCLLSDYTVGTSSSAGYTALLDSTSLAEQFPYPDFDTTVARGDRHMMGAGVGFRIQFRESVSANLLGYADDIEGTVDLLPMMATRFPPSSTAGGLAGGGTPPTPIFVPHPAFD